MLTGQTASLYEGISVGPSVHPTVNYVEKRTEGRIQTGPNGLTSLDIIASDLNTMYTQYTVYSVYYTLNT